MDDRSRSLAVLLNRLALHCPFRDLPEAQAALRMEDTIRDLLPFDPRQVADACDAWRRGPIPFFPTSGQLIAQIKAVSESRIPHPGGHARETYRAPKMIEGPRGPFKSARQILAEKRLSFPQPETEKTPRPAEQEIVDANGLLSPERRTQLAALRERVEGRNDVG